MAFTVQNDTGTQAAANSYDTVANFKSYHDDRGNSYAGKGDGEIQAAMVKATDFVDNHYLYNGTRLVADQTTEFPREDLTDAEGNSVTGVPTQVKEATYEYALQSLNGVPLEIDTTASTGNRLVKRKRTKVGEIETETEFDDPSYSGQPVFTRPDNMLLNSGFVANAGSNKSYR